MSPWQPLLWEHIHSQSRLIVLAAGVIMQLGKVCSCAQACARTQVFCVSKEKTSLLLDGAEEKAPQDSFASLC